MVFQISFLHVDGGTVTEDVVHRGLEHVMVCFNMDLFTGIKYVYFHRKH